jgi:hypothetical protein
MSSVSLPGVVEAVTREHAARSDAAAGLLLAHATVTVTILVGAGLAGGAAAVVPRSR